jgi:hypothetical protein
MWQSNVSLADVTDSGHSNYVVIKRSEIGSVASERDRHAIVHDIIFVASVMLETMVGIDMDYYFSTKKSVAFVR